MSANGRAAQRNALVVGISDYTSLQQLDFCKNDGTEVYKVLTSLGYEISDKNKIVDEVKGEKVRDAICDFFDDKRNNLDDLVSIILVMAYLILLMVRCTLHRLMQILINRTEEVFRLTILE